MYRKTIKSQTILMVVLCLLLCAGLVASVRAANVISTTTGASANRVDVVFVGDGYQEGELDVFHEHVDGAIDYMFFGTEDPFNRYHNFFNFHRIEVISAESGADVPPENILVDTALGAKYFFDGVTERLLSINTLAADNIVNRSLPPGIDVDMRFATINSDRFGGAGGRYATFAGGDASAFEIALHEIAHSFSDLADEYVSFSTPYTRGEPGEINVTTDPTGAKWEQWLGYEQEGIGTIGVYEGARYHPTGIYRPSLDSKMRSLNRPFDAVSREKMVLDIYTHVDPIDAHQANTTPLGFFDDAWVETVDSEVITTRWFVNDSPVGSVGSDFAIADLFSLGFANGNYTLTAEAVDETDWIRLEDQRPRERVSWDVAYFPGDFNGDQLVDAMDMDMLSEAIWNNSSDLNFDLTQDSLLDQSDRDFWVDVNRSFYGDTDLNGAVDFADFLVLSGHFGTDSTSWAHGNFDAVAGVGFGDFLLLSANFGKTPAAALASVPEPATWKWAAVVVVAGWSRRRRR